MCARQGESFGIVEGLVPPLAAQLDDARGSAMLRAFHAESQADQLKRLGKQLVAGGRRHAAYCGITGRNRMAIRVAATEGSTCSPSGRGYANGNEVLQCISAWLAGCCSRCDKRLLWKLAYNMGFKGALSVHRHKLRLKRGQVFPPFLYVSIINTCNLRCQGCWVDVAA